MCEEVKNTHPDTHILTYTHTKIVASQPDNTEQYLFYLT